MDYPYELERGSTKHICPSCGRKTFVRVVEIRTGNYLPDRVGRCDRESNCGYQCTWKEWRADNAGTSARNGAAGGHDPSLRSASPGNKASHHNRPALARKRRPDYLEAKHLLDCIGGYDRNTFANFLLTLFPYDTDWVVEKLSDYVIGTRNGFTVFPTIDRLGRVCKAKLIKYDPTGHTLRDLDGKRAVTSLEYLLRREGLLPEDFQTDKDVFFGEHLLRKYPTRPIGVVESEKTAVVATTCNGAFPCEIVWLATGSKQWLNAKRLGRLGPRSIVLYPDADGFEKWSEVAANASRLGVDVRVSELIEGNGTFIEKRKQYDLADYLIREQEKRNDPEIEMAFRDTVEERLAIMTIDGGITDEEAKAQLLASSFYEEAIREACSSK